ncbi:MAG TPA: putative toxin-antitoxin system toxin component, PIN family [Pirellulales bacterium]|nr:putative toxin-antitoxin system toxin component, PIN family [Pirellulales bacterium]
MHVVLDTNVLVRAAPGRTGPARELLELVAKPPHVVVSSPPLLDELARALAYPRLRLIHGLDDAGISQYVADVEAVAMVVPLITPTVTAIESDPDDNAVIAAAIAGQAEVICTRDRHFRDPRVVHFCASYGIRILDDVELLRELRGS